MILSLFPGIGLLDRAFELEGFCVVRGPDVIWGGDVRAFHPPPGVFAGVIGGPPCQSFSPLANLGRAKGFEPRFGNLIPEFERVVRAAAPRWFLMENVRGAPVPVVEGYAVRTFLLCNSSLGERQKRLRRWSFGVRGETRLDLRSYIDLAPLKLPRSEQTLTVTGRNSGEKSPKGGRFENFTLAEMLVLQGLPSDYLEHCPFTANGKRKAIGNGVPIPMGRALARAVLEATR